MHILAPVVGVVVIAAMPGDLNHRAGARPERQAASSPLSAQQVLERSADAIGGLERLRAIAAVRVEEQGHEYLLTIPSDPHGPRLFVEQSIATLRRAKPVGVRRTVDQIFPMRPGHFAQATVASATAAGVVRAGAMAAGGGFDLESTLDEMALAPDRVLLSALAASEQRVERDSTIGGTPHHIVSFPWPRGRVYLAINARTWFPMRVQVVRAYPALVYWAMWDQVTIESVWSAWSLEPNGVWYPRQRTSTFNGEPYHEYTVTSLDFAPAAPADSFAIPDAVATRFAAAARAAEQSVDPVLTPVSLTEGITLFQGGYQSAIVREPRGVIVIDAPESGAKSRAVLQQAARLYPGVPVSAVITTSPAWMHIAGLAEYARRGVPIYALDVNEPEIAALLSAPRGTDDSAKATGRRGTIIPVRDVLKLGSGENRLELIPARGIHGIAMMLVYWPAHQLLYASDMIIPPTFEPTFTAAYEADLRRTIDRLQLPVSTVFALHLPPAPWPPRSDSAGADRTQPSR